MFDQQFGPVFQLLVFTFLKLTLDQFQDQFAKYVFAFV